MVEVYCLNIGQNINQSMLREIAGLIGADKKARIDKFTKEEDRARMVLADVLVRSLIVKKIGLKNSQITFAKNRYGKPFLNECQGFSFSLSHAGDWVVCSIGQEENGVDVELVQPVDLGVARRFFTRREYEAILSQPAAERTRAFYKIWTLKESYIKAIGTGLSTPLDSFVIEELDDCYSVRAMGKHLDYSFRTYDINPDYYISVCSKEPTISEKIICQDLTNVIEDVVS